MADDEKQQTPDPKDAKSEVTISKDDLESLNKDIESAKKTLAKEAKEEATKELELQQQLKEREESLKTLQADVEKREKETQDKLQGLQNKIDQLATSKAVVSNNDPFEEPKPKSQSSIVDAMSNDQINDIERNSARKMLGESFDERY